MHELRRELGLPAGASPIYEGQHSPTRVLALFSPLFATPQPDWPPNLLLTGFPFWDEDAMEPEAEVTLQEFLNAGPAPLVFTLGTSAVLDPGRFYAESIEAVRQLGCRAILLGAPAGIPIPSGKDFLALPYAPHDRVFRAASVVVHSGGIGTTARVLRAGRPALVVPWAYDQPDNAARLVRMGVAQTLGRRSYAVRSAVRELRLLMSEPQYKSDCLRLADQVQAEDGVGTACAALESCVA